MTDHARMPMATSLLTAVPTPSNLALHGALARSLVPAGLHSLHRLLERLHGFEPNNSAFVTIRLELTSVLGAPVLQQPDPDSRELEAVLAKARFWLEELATLAGTIETPAAQIMHADAQLVAASLWRLVHEMKPAQSTPARPRLTVV